MVLHCDSEGQPVTVQLLVLWSATTIAAQRPPMEASGLEMCIAVGKTCHAEVDASLGSSPGRRELWPSCIYEVLCYKYMTCR